MNDARLDLRLSKELLARVKEAAGGGSVNAFVRDALEHAVSKNRRLPPAQHQQHLSTTQITPVPKQPSSGLPTGPGAAPGMSTRIQQTVVPSPETGDEIPLLDDLPASRTRRRPLTDSAEVSLPKIAPRRWGK